MKNTKKKNLSLRELLLQKIDSLYDIEQQLVKALPKLAKASTDQKLKEVLRTHLTETRTHIIRLEQVYALLGGKPKKLKVEGIRGIAKDGEWVIKNIQGTDALDSSIIRTAQYAEHYEMAGYMGAVAWAETLGESNVASILGETLGEEEGSDKRLAILAMDLDEKVIEPIEAN